MFTYYVCYKTVEAGCADVPEFNPNSSVVRFADHFNSLSDARRRLRQCIVSDAQYVIPLDCFGFSWLYWIYRVSPSGRIKVFDVEVR